MMNSNPQDNYSTIIQDLLDETNRREGFMAADPVLMGDLIRLIGRETQVPYIFAYGNATSFRTESTAGPKLIECIGQVRTADQAIDMIAFAASQVVVDLLVTYRYLQVASAGGDLDKMDKEIQPIIESSIESIESFFSSPVHINIAKLANREHHRWLSLGRTLQYKFINAPISLQGGFCIVFGDDPVLSDYVN